MIETKRSQKSTKRGTNSPLRQTLQDITQGSSDTKRSQQKFYESLGPNLKEFYLDKKEFMKLFDDIDVAFFCMEEVILPFFSLCGKAKYL